MAAHRLVVYGATARADAALRELALAGEGRMSVVRLVAQEPEGSGCCDTRSVLWNEISRDLGREDLARAARFVDVHGDASVEVVLFSGRRPDEAVIREAVARDADEIVLADGRGTVLGWIARRRLRQRSPVPVRAA
jgi:hypothetical protein